MVKWATSRSSEILPTEVSAMRFGLLLGMFLLFSTLGLQSVEAGRLLGRRAHAAKKMTPHECECLQAYRANVEFINAHVTDCCARQFLVKKAREIYCKCLRTNPCDSCSMALVQDDGFRADTCFQTMVKQIGMGRPFKEVCMEYNVCALNGQYNEPQINCDDAL